MNLHCKIIIFAIKLYLISNYVLSIERIDITIYNKNKHIKFNAELANTLEKRSKGLMYKKNLPNNEAMLFVFPFEDIIQLWMKNTYIPLDVIFISKDKYIVDLNYNMKKLSETLIKSKVKSKYALEFNAGLIKKLGIKIGNKVFFNE